MKRFFTITIIAAFAALALLSCKSKPAGGYTVSGCVPTGTDAEWIYVYSVYGDTPVAIDSARIQNGTFRISGIAPDTAMFAVLHPGTINQNQAVGWNLIIEEGDIVVDTLSMFATGTPLNDGFSSWSTIIDSIMYTGEPADLVAFLREHWSEHSADFVGTFVLYNMSPYLQFEFVDSLAAQVPDNIRSISIFRDFFGQLEAVRKSQPGSPFIDISLSTVEGSPAKLSDFIGKGNYLLVDFWASWCGPCRQAMPQLQATVKSHPQLKVIGIALRDEVEDTRRAMSDLGITWPVLCDPATESAKVYGVNAIPAMILFSPDGTILARDFEVAKIDSLLSENQK